MSSLEVGLDDNGKSAENTPSDETPENSQPSDPETVCSWESSSNGVGKNSNSSDTFKPIKIPIVGYEVMEERAKFTVFKLRIEGGEDDVCWFVFRRYTDFTRLHSKLKTDYPNISLPLPKKKWFGDNFNQNFLDERIEGLQDLINAIVKHKELLTNINVRDFFCLDEPPSIADNVEESKAVVEALEEKIFHLQRQLKEKETAYERLKAAHSVEISAKLRLAGFVQECTKQCPSCATRLSQLGQITPQP